MNSSFIIRLLITAVIMGAGYYFLTAKLPPALVYHGYLYILIFFTSLTALFHNGLTKSALSGTKHFIRFYMTATAIKLFLYVGVIMIYAVINKAGAIAFALCFLLHYCVFTVFEVWMAYRQFGGLKNSSSQQNNSINGTGSE
jgi:hypothetical protein